jgi:hypothetical protein
MRVAKNEIRVIRKQEAPKDRISVTRFLRKYANSSHHKEAGRAFERSMYTKEFLFKINGIKGFYFREQHMTPFRWYISKRGWLKDKKRIKTGKEGSGDWKDVKKLIYNPNYEAEPEGTPAAKEKNLIYGPNPAWFSNNPICYDEEVEVPKQASIDEEIIRETIEILRINGHHLIGARQAVENYGLSPAYVGSMRLICDGIGIGYEPREVVASLEKMTEALHAGALRETRAA